MFCMEKEHDPTWISLPHLVPFFGDKFCLRETFLHVEGKAYFLIKIAWGKGHKEADLRQ